MRGPSSRNRLLVSTEYSSEQIAMLDGDVVFSGVRRFQSPQAHSCLCLNRLEHSREPVAAQLIDDGLVELCIQLRDSRPVIVIRRAAHRLDELVEGRDGLRGRIVGEVNSGGDLDDLPDEAHVLDSVLVQTDDEDATVTPML
jgi:hypothetical protein